MNLTIEIPDDRAASFQREAQARGMTVDRWLLALAEQNAPALSPQDCYKGGLIKGGLSRYGGMQHCGGGEPR